MIFEKEREDLMRELSRIEQVDLRDIWPSESQDFTRWLAKQENLNLLSETLQLSLEIEETEKSIGPFRADIICKDVSRDGLVVIENQLEKSDHTHLGQILAYAAGVQAQTIVWIAKEFTEQHRATFDWLNSKIGRDINFFAVKVCVWKIKDSDPAPKFEILVQPNDWSNQVAEAARKCQRENLSETEQLQFEYWTAFNEQLEGKAKSIQPKRPRSGCWIGFPIGKSKILLAAVMDSREECIRVELYLKGSDAKKYFQELRDQKSNIEREIGTELEWEGLEKALACRILLRLRNTDLSDKIDWPRQHAWMTKHLEIFKKAFEPRVRNLGLKEAS
jgi:hypothetical protein